MSTAKKTDGGYVAIMTTIIISLILLAMIAENGFAGWQARFVALNREKKHQSEALARGCIDAALSSLVKNPGLASSTFSLHAGTCTVQVVDTSDPDAVELRVESTVGNAETGGVAYTTMKIIADVGDIHLGSTTLTSAPTPSVLSVTVISQQETAK